jgi:methylenetetrahydrofolate dehydrogenase (NADP+)/methenyltetrahydrofolate cyclohydrolase
MVPRFFHGFESPDPSLCSKAASNVILQDLTAISAPEVRLPARILNGNLIRDQILSELKAEVAELSARGLRPGLAAVLVGEDPASQIYVRNKIKACEQLGIFSENITPSANISTDELLAVVADLNQRDDIDGILMQLPLPPQVDAGRMLLAVAPAKDVDGFHPMSLGSLVTKRPGLVACTPAGLIEILKRSEIPIAGKHAVVIGRSDIVGKPVALLLLHENATVTICHSKTADLPAIARQADILVAAIGRPAFVTREFIKPGATVLDVGINRLTDAAEVERIFAGLPERLQQFRAKGTILVGDAHPKDMAELAGAYTPVPGGVGPLTIAMLMSNTVKAARLRRGR